MIWHATKKQGEFTGRLALLEEELRDERRRVSVDVLIYTRQAAPREEVRSGELRMMILNNCPHHIIATRLQITAKDLSPGSVAQNITATDELNLPLPPFAHHEGSLHFLLRESIRGQAGNWPGKYVCKFVLDWQGREINVIGSVVLYFELSLSDHGAKELRYLNQAEGAARFQ